MRRAVEVMLVVAVLIDVGYWATWFTDRDLLASRHVAAYYEFEDAFPLADAWLGLACVLALVALRRRSPSALLWMLCAGSAGLYLAGMDLLYDLEHGILLAGAGGTVEAGIVAITIAFSLTALRFGWTRREALLSGET